jgi:DNA-binding MarR family transcriptional regulator
MSSEPPQRPRYVGALLRPCWQWVWQRISAGVLESGFDDLNPAHIGLFRHPGFDGRRPTEVAEQMQITKQSVNELLAHLEQRGYLTREPDPTDGRARIIRVTAKGRHLEDVINAQARAAELEIADHLGPRRFAQLKSALTEFAAYASQDTPSSHSRAEHRAEEAQTAPANNRARSD